MFRFFLVTALFATPLITNAEILRGTIASTTTCVQSGILITLQGTTTKLVQHTMTKAYPSGAAPVLGYNVFALTSGVATCNAVVGKALSHVSYAAPSEHSGGTPGSGGGGQGGGGGGQGPGGSAGGQGTPGPGQKPGSGGQGDNPAKPSGTGQGAGLPFGGAITTPVIHCDDGSRYVKNLSAPTPGDYLWTPATKSYEHGPPAFVSQWLLGLFRPPKPCTVDGNVVGMGQVIDFHGSSGSPTAPPSQKPPPTKPPVQGQCKHAGMPTNTPNAKLEAERAAREELAACGIKVASSKTKGAPCAPGQNGLTAGCTDVSGLSCEAVVGICEIAKKCPLTIIGGSEPGHHTTGTGREIDVIMDPACIARNFVPLDQIGCKYKDPVSGSTFRNEAVCPAARTTGDHIHICIRGTGC